jgi:hypothetical protein
VEISEYFDLKNQNTTNCGALEFESRCGVKVTGSHPASKTMGTGENFHVDKAAEA